MILLNKKYHKLLKERKLWLRTLALAIVKDAGAVVVDDTRLTGMGRKNHVGPSYFRDEIKRAAENVGCLFCRVKIKEERPRTRAGFLRKEAEKILLESKKDNSLKEMA
jgi:hypothetical protein